MKASFLLFVVCLGALAVCNAGDLQKQFYKKSCPLAEDIVRNITQQRVSANSALPAKLLRMHFHDCFVRGCDASVLLNSTANNTAEKDATPNLSLSGFDVIDEIKAQLEQTCPGVVSCADIVALSARDSVSFQVHIQLEWPTAMTSATGSTTSQGKGMQTLLSTQPIQLS